MRDGIGIRKKLTQYAVIIKTKKKLGMKYVFSHHSVTVSLPHRLVTIVILTDFFSINQWVPLSNFVVF